MSSSYRCLYFQGKSLKARSHFSINNKIYIKHFYLQLFLYFFSQVVFKNKKSKTFSFNCRCMFSIFCMLSLSIICKLSCKFSKTQNFMNIGLPILQIPLMNLYFLCDDKTFSCAICLLTGDDP